MMLRLLLLLASLCWVPFAASAESRAKNVILFLGDAGGIPTLNAAGVYGHDQPQSLFIQSMPHLALSDTSSLDQWVTDSAAGMTAIVTGHKTNNGMLSQLPGEASRPLKTILEYAEEKGCSTGVITNMPVWDATPAACYAHVSSRKSTVEIFSQVFTPRFGDGVDVLIGADRKNLYAAAEKAGLDIPANLEKSGYAFYASPNEIPAGAKRVISIYDGGDFDPQPVVDRVIDGLARNDRGYFLMVEWDMHTSKVEAGLKRALVMDELIRHVAQRASPDTLIIFAADHSFDLRLKGGKKGQPMAAQIETGTNTPAPGKPVISVGTSHTGEEILVAGQGPGAERLHGFISNTRIFFVMMDAYGWSESP